MFTVVGLVHLVVDRHGKQSTYFWSDQLSVNNVFVVYQENLEIKDQHACEECIVTKPP